MKYSSELKKSVPNQIAIGKLNDEGMLIPNRNYFEIFDELENLELPKERSDYVSFGPHLVVKKIVDNLSLYDFMNSIFDDNGYFLSYARKAEEIKKIINRAGFFTIITSTKMRAEEALERYLNLFFYMCLMVS